MDERRKGYSIVEFVISSQRTGCGAKEPLPAHECVEGFLDPALKGVGTLCLVLLLRRKAIGNATGRKDSM